MTVYERADEYAKERMKYIQEERKRFEPPLFLVIKNSFKDGFIQGEESKDVHWYTPEEIPTNEESKSYTINVLNNLHQIVYYSFSEGCWIEDGTSCEADKFQAWCYLPEYKEK